ncbi:hypothetical protein FH972_009985 [Carpinus fangiana]|uniref:U2A'/phosphoprotein 32 family A C-terminal domain-containing protein n=1 Tax=Carpinus fangiana TaxID=176857 RepID=A0A660KTW3_9ROSI|nr:hypothetical protein FH972_009985 [Carpinus fangiana]
MTRLSSEQVLKGNTTSDPNSVSSLKLTYKALSDVSCLSGFKNLERLDLTFNNLTSLEGLKACVNLKWLAVVQNKLESLRGIEGISKLIVLNAGKNKLKSMDEVRSLMSLRALILNDNEIISICKLDQMTDLNTLVLSRNPISQIGESLLKVKSLTKLSLANCQLQTIGSSLKSCVELKELRLAHNGIMTLPNELARNKKLQNLDLGNNVILRWSDLKVLTSLVNLKNLNLQGNPAAEKDTLAKKIKNVLPNLLIFNAKPTDKYTKKNSERVDDSTTNDTNRLEVLKEEKRDVIRKKNSKRHVMDSEDDHHDKDVDVEKESRQKKQKKNEKLSKKEVPVHEGVDGKVEKNLKKISKMEQGELNIIDDPEASFADLFAADTAENPKYDDEKKIVGKTIQDTNLVGGLVEFSVKKKKAKSPTMDLTPTVEVGMGGPSTWGDE